MLKTVGFFDSQLWYKSYQMMWNYLKPFLSNVPYLAKFPFFSNAKLQSGH